MRNSEDILPVIILILGGITMIALGLYIDFYSTPSLTCKQIEPGMEMNGVEVLEYNETVVHLTVCSGVVCKPVYMSITIKIGVNNITDDVFILKNSTGIYLCGKNYDHIIVSSMLEAGGLVWFLFGLAMLVYIVEQKR